MYQIPKITKEANQSMVLNISDNNKATMVIRYIDNLRSWYMDITYGTKSIMNRRICTNGNLLRPWHKILPFGVACFTLDGTEPVNIDDFEAGRCGLTVLTAAEAENYELYLNGQKQ